MAPQLRVPLSVALALAGLCAVALPSSAEEGRWASSTPEQRARKQTELMQEKLALSDEQLPRVEAINLEAAKKIQAVFAGSERRGEKLRSARKVQEQKEAALRAVLSDEQFRKFLAARDEISRKVEERVREKRADGEAAPAP